MLHKIHTVAPNMLWICCLGRFSLQVTTGFGFSSKQKGPIHRDQDHSCHHSMYMCPPFSKPFKKGYEFAFLYGNGPMSILTSQQHCLNQFLSNPGALQSLELHHRLGLGISPLQSWILFPVYSLEVQPRFRTCHENQEWKTTISKSICRNFLIKLRQLCLPNRGWTNS